MENQENQCRETTEHNETEKALKESEELFSKTFHANPAPMAISTLDGRFIDVNESYTKLTGYSRDELVGKISIEVNIITLEERERYINKLEKGSIQEMELEITTKSGEKLNVLSSTESFKIEDEIRIISFVYDITDRKKAEEALRESEEKFRSLYSSITEGVAIHNVLYYSSHEAVDYIITDVNPAYENITGLKRSEVIGKKASELYGTGKPPYIDIYSRVAENGEPAHFETYFEPMDKHFRIAVTSPDKGQFATFFDDITERKRAEEYVESLLGETQHFAEELEVSNEELRATTEELQVSNDELRHQGNELLHINRAYRALSNNSKAIIRAEDEQDYLESVCKIIVDDCGYPMVWIGYAEENKNKAVRPVAYSGFEEGYLKMLNISWADTERGRGPTGIAIRTGKPSMCKNMLTDSKFKPWRAEAIKRGYASSLVLPLMDKNKVFGALNIYSKESDPFSDEEVKLMTELANDIAYGLNSIRLYIANIEAEKALRAAHNNLELKVQERTKELEKTNEELLRSNQELESFAYITSHDLQEPLRSIASYAQLIQRRYEGQLDSDADEFLEFMVSGATRMKSMIQGLLDYSRVNRAGIEFVKTDMDVKLEKAIANLQYAINGANVRITHDPLPNIIADPDQMVSVFQNLIGNAIKFKKVEEPSKIHISAYTEEESNEYIFSVQDNGIGMEKQYTDKIFDVFKRLHAIGEYEGAGIGLSIVKRVIEHHGGRIWVESEFGVGSTFYFTIPIKDENGL